MKKFCVSLMLGFALFCLFVTASVHAQTWSPNEPSANQWRNWDQSRDPGYQSAVRSGGRYGGYYGGVYDSYYPPVIYYEQNNVKRNTARRNGNYYKACPNGDPAVPIDVPCPGTTGYTQQPSRYTDSYNGSSEGTHESSYVSGGYLITVRIDANGNQTEVNRMPITRR